MSMDFKNALRVLARLVSRKPSEKHKLEKAIEGRLRESAHVVIEVAQETGRPIGEALAKQLEKETDPVVPMILSAIIPSNSPALADAFRVVVEKGLKAVKSDRVAYHLGGKVLPVRNTDIGRAMFLQDLANEYSISGRHDEAVASAMEAVEIYRRCTETGDDVYLLNLVGALHRLAECLLSGNRTEGAILCNEEATGICRRFLNRFPEDVRREHCRTQLASCQSLDAHMRMTLGKLSQALTSAEEAVAIYQSMRVPFGESYDYSEATNPTQRSLWKKRCADSNTLFALALMTLARIRFELGNAPAAIEPARKAIILKRDLAQDYPDSHARALGYYCSALSRILAECGQTTEAAAFSKEAKQILE